MPQPSALEARPRMVAGCRQRDRSAYPANKATRSHFADRRAVADAIDFLGEAAAADTETAHYSGDLVEVSLFDMQVMSGDRLESADEIIDRGRRLAAAAVDQKHDPGFESVDLRKIA